MAAHNYSELARHVGHEIVCMHYGDGENVAVECEECCEVLLDFDRPAPATGQRPARAGDPENGEEDPRNVVEVSAEGFQVLDTRTETLRADVWSTREQAQDACEELNGSVSAAGAS